MLAVRNLTGNNTIFSRETRLMGTRFEISVGGYDEIIANGHLDLAVAEVNRVEKMLSTFTDDSKINEINRNAGIRPVKVDGEIYRLTERALQIAELTYGAFDITYPANPAGDESTKAAKRKISLSNYKSVVLDAAKQTVFLKNKGMRLGFASVSRGYAADRAKYILQMNGATCGIVNAGGDLLTWGLQPNNAPWTIGTADRSKADAPYANIEISNMAFATSFNSNAATTKSRFADNIQPETGFEVSGINSVSIITPTAELADAMATPVMAMGINAGLYLVNRLNQMACIITDDRQRIYTSKSVTLG